MHITSLVINNNNKFECSTAVIFLLFRPIGEEKSVFNVWYHLNHYKFNHFASVALMTKYHVILNWLMDTVNHNNYCIGIFPIQTRQIEYTQIWQEGKQNIYLKWTWTSRLNWWYPIIWIVHFDEMLLNHSIIYCIVSSNLYNRSCVIGL